MGKRVVRAVGRVSRGFFRSFEPCQEGDAKCCGRATAFRVTERTKAGDESVFTVCASHANSEVWLPAGEPSFLAGLS
jgi:hypothetical protein